MVHYFLKRCGVYLAVLFGITVISFSIIHMAPGSPLDYLVDPNTPLEAIVTKEKELGLDRPLPVQYFKWLEAVLKGDLGYSIARYGQPVSEVVGERIFPTLQLSVSALVAGALIAVPLGIISAVRRNSKVDYITTSTALLSVSVPNFFLAMLLIYLFCLKLKLLPSNGMFTFGAARTLPDTVRHMILPCSVLAFGVAGNLVRYVRAGMTDVLDQDYMRTAKSKGLSSIRVIFKHGLKNAMNIIITAMAGQTAGLLGGAIVIEQIFSWPGLGTLAYESIQGRDYATIMAINLITGVLVLLVYFVTDLLYVAIDPRVKLK